MNYTLLEKNLNAKQFDNIYLLWGDEEFLLDTTIKKIKKNFGELMQGINYIILDENTTSEIIPNIEAPAFGFDKKLIIVNNSKIFKKDGRKKSLTPIQEKILNYFTDNLDIVKESVTIIFKETEVDKSDLLTLFEKIGTTCEFTELKPIEIVPRIKKICEGYKVKISDTTVNKLIELSGTKMQNLINEIRKLIEYKGSGNEITVRDVELLATKQMESIIFELTDNLAIKKIDKSLEILNNLIYQKEPLQKILVTLYNHFKKLYLFSMATYYKKDPVLALELKPNQTFLVNKYRNQVRYFDTKTLREIIEKLSELDYLYKVGKIDIDTGLRSILSYYCS